MSKIIESLKRGNCSVVDNQGVSITQHFTKCLEKEFADLEAKLAEKETGLSLARNEIDTLKHNLKVAQEHDNVMCEQYFEKCKNYEQQFAEKDNKIQMLNAMIATLPEHDKELKEICNQDKISFAVEKLEKVKDMIYRFDVSCDEINNLTIALDNYTNGFHKAKFKATILIDNQIEELKKEKK